jgi:hypothetical protein
MKHTHEMDSRELRSNMRSSVRCAGRPRTNTHSGLQPWLPAWTFELIAPRACLHLPHRNLNLRVYQIGVGGKPRVRTKTRSFIPKMGSHRRQFLSVGPVLRDVATRNPFHFINEADQPQIPFLSTHLF